MSPPSPPPSPPPPLLLAVCVATLSAAAAFLLHHRRRPHPPLPPHSTPAYVSALMRLYLSHDPDPASRAALRALQPRLSHPPTRARLAAALSTAARLRFGTAGLRARMGPGYDRLNALVVIAAAQAVVDVLASRAHRGGVVVGYDARHNSRKFAVAVAAVCDAAGVRVLLFERCVPTPWVAFAVTLLGCAAGFCVTASHNPPSDNGLKLFWTDGIQVRPDDAAEVERAMKANIHPWRRYSLLREDLGPSVADPYEDVQRAYYERVVMALRMHSEEENARTGRVVYTACHGVGWPFVRRMFAEFGLPEPVPVVEQCEPDPDFPTLPFPNPEEPGAMDMAIERARKVGARLVLANDPDADRLGAAEVGEGGKTVRAFNGNEIAVLLADYLTNGKTVAQVGQSAVVASTVSSKILKSMAKRRGFTFCEALTGFKWLNKVAVDLEEEGKTVLLTYEEALGFNVTRNIVRDKDGISAAAVLAEMAGALYVKGSSLVRRLDELLDECGVHQSNNGYLRTSERSASTDEIFERARETGLPEKLGNARVVSWRDLTNGKDTGEESEKAVLPSDPRGQFLTFRCAREGSNAQGDECPLIIHLRGSGTEPKIKYYGELRCTKEEVANGSAKAFLDSAVSDAIDKILRPKDNSLVQ